MKRKDYETVVVFDIRNFSAHRYHLGKPENRGGGSLLTQLVTDILNLAVDLLESKEQAFSSEEEHLLNHTGDGFVLVVRGSRNALIALWWISKFRDRVSARMKRYDSQRRKEFKKVKLDPLNFGIGAHSGIIMPLKFKTFGDRYRDGFLGSAANIASRVEQCTKDHSCNVICTKLLWDRALKFIKKRHHKDTEVLRQSLGKHRLRGFPNSYTLYCLEPGFHERITKSMLER